MGGVGGGGGGVFGTDSHIKLVGKRLKSFSFESISFISTLFCCDYVSHLFYSLI